MPYAFVVYFLCVLALATASQVYIDPAAQWEGKPWLGKFVSTGRQENGAAFTETLGFELEPEQKVYHQIWKEGDRYVHDLVVAPGSSFRENRVFRLGQEFQTHAHSYDGQSESANATYTEDGDKLVADVAITGKPRRRFVYEVQGDQMIATYTKGNVVARRWFERRPHDSST